MDIFKFINPTSPTLMQQGQIINGIKSKMWVERYRDAGEFKFVADISSDIRKQLPIGTFISHTDTAEIMIVENHEINDSKNSEPEITVTGRSFETILDNRIVGTNRTMPVAAQVGDIVQPSNYSWIQAVNLINNHISSFAVMTADEVIPYIIPMYDVIAAGEAPGTTKLKRVGLYTAVVELIAPDDIGIKNYRPGPWSPLAGTGNAPNVAISIQKGKVKTSTVVFSYSSGVIESADYFWSNKTAKNGAYIVGKWLETVIYSTTWAGTINKNYNRRLLYVDGSDIDGDLTAPPPIVGGLRDEYVQKMQLKGLAALKTQQGVAISNVHASNEVLKPKFRTDYDVGDIITVVGDYKQSTSMRVIEYVETEDENGESAYPTFADYIP